MASEEEKYQKVTDTLGRIMDETSKVIVGQEEVREQLLVSILCDGNILVESVPGLGKTKMVRTLSDVMGLEFSRIQNTPDLMPSDITGTHIIDESSDSKEFVFQEGPIFANMVLADEINRATPKTQSALLEAMQERQVTAGNQSYELDDPFFLMATQNPLEQEGSLHPDETVYMDGELWRAGDAAAYAREEGTVVHEGEDTTVYAVDATTQTLTDGGEITTVDCHVYETDYDGEVYTVETRTGRRIRVSGNHPFLVNRGGKIQWVEARELEEGDALVAPEQLDPETEPFPSHDAVLEELGNEHTLVRQEDVDDAVEHLEDDDTLTREDVDTLRIAAGLSKKELAGRIDASYDQVINYLDGAENSIPSQVREELDAAEVTAADHVEAHRIHTFRNGLSDGEAGAFVGLILSDGTFSDSSVKVYQKNYPALVELWVRLAEKLGFEPRMRETDGTMEAVIDAKPLVDYLDSRYSLRTPEQLLDAPEAFRKQFLQTFLLAESHFDPEQKRVTFTQKDEDTVNLIAHMLQQFGIRPWIADRGRVFRIKIQGRDLQTYLELFPWPGERPDVDLFDGTHRTVPVDPGRMQRIVDLLGLKYDGLSERDWYQSFRMHRQRDEGEITERSLRSFIEDMEQEVQRRKDVDVETAARDDLQGTAQQCGVAITDIVDSTGLTKHAVWSAYDRGKTETEAIQYVTEQYEERVAEAERLLTGLNQLVDNDVFYDEITQLESEPYEGTVVGLSVPRTHNYLAGRGACGINHNTYPLPEAQMDRFMMKIFVDYPEIEEEAAIVDRFTTELEYDPELEEVLSQGSILKLQEVTRQVPIAEDIRDRAVAMVAATRDRDTLSYGASPRGSLNLVLAAKAHALVEGRTHVSNEDIDAMAKPVLRHRIGLNFQAERDGLEPDDVIDEIVGEV